MLDTLYGLRVITSVYLTEPKEVKRTWRQRLWSWPWRPWLKTRVIEVPRTDFFKVGNVIYAHPQTWDAVRHALEKSEQP